MYQITTLIQHGYALQYRTIQELAEIFQNQQVCSVNDDDIQLIKSDAIGKDWVARFLSHHAELKSIRRKYIELARIKDVSVERLTKWVEDLQCIIEENNFESKNIYNIDKTGLAISDVEAS